MKKLLVLALAVSSTVALTACGSADKTVSNFIERHINVVDSEGVAVDSNYTVDVGGKSFKVAGNLLNTGSDFYEVNEDASATYWTYASNINQEDTDGSTTKVEVQYMETLTAAEFKADSAAYNAANNPFAQLTAAQTEVLGENELSYKNFKSVTEKDEEGNSTTTYFFVVDKTTTKEDSPMTLEFSYNLNEKEKTTKEFATATINFNNTTWVYSNLSNEDYEFGATAHTINTPGETVNEEIINLINAQDDMTVKFDYVYTTTSGTVTDTTATVRINNGAYHFDFYTSAVTDFYLEKNEDGTYTKTTVDSGTWYIQETVTAEEVDALTQLEAVLDHEALDAGVHSTFTNNSSYYNAYNSVDYDKIPVGGYFARTEFSSYKVDGKTALSVEVRTRGNDNENGNNTYISQYTITFNDYEALDADGEVITPSISDEIASLNIVNENFKTIVEMLNATSSNALSRNYTFTNASGLVRNIANGLMEELDADGGNSDFYVEIGHELHSGSTSRDKIYVAGSGNWALNTASALSYHAIGTGVNGAYSTYSSKGTEVIDGVTYLVFEVAVTSSNGQSVTIYVTDDLADCFAISGTSLNEGLTPQYSRYENFGAVTVTLPTVGDAAPTFGDAE